MNNKKLQLFNYFVQKLVEFQKQMFSLQTLTSELALTNLLLCEDGYLLDKDNFFKIPKYCRCFCSCRTYLEELLFIVCVQDIDEKTGRHPLFDVFNGFYSTKKGVKDPEIQLYFVRKHFNTVFEGYRDSPSVPKEIEAVIRPGKLAEHVQKGDILYCHYSTLECAAPCMETERIDLALEKLFKIPWFIIAFAPEKKPMHLEEVFPEFASWQSHCIYNNGEPIELKDACAEKKKFLDYLKRMPGRERRADFILYNEYEEYLSNMIFKTKNNLRF